VISPILRHKIYTGNSQRYYSPTNTTDVNIDLCTSPVRPPNKHLHCNQLPTAAANSLTAWKWVVVISASFIIVWS